MHGTDGQRDGAAVHVHLRGATDEEAATRLRERLAGVLAAGAHVRVHVEEQDDLGLDVLRTLSAAGEALTVRGGTLLLVGAGPQVRRRLRLHDLEVLLDGPAEVDPYPARGTGTGTGTHTGTGSAGRAR